MVSLVIGLAEQICIMYQLLLTNHDLLYQSVCTKFVQLKYFAHAKVLDEIERVWVLFVRQKTQCPQTYIFTGFEDNEGRKLPL